VLTSLFISTSDAERNDGLVDWPTNIEARHDYAAPAAADFTPRPAAGGHHVEVELLPEWSTACTPTSASPPSAHRPVVKAARAQLALWPCVRG